MPKIGLETSQNNETI